MYTWLADQGERQTACGAQLAKDSHTPSATAQTAAPVPEEGWLQISNEELSSEGDLSDLEDNDLVGPDPRSLSSKLNLFIFWIL